MSGVNDRSASMPRPGATVRPTDATPSRPDLECPYPGLPPFEEEDADVFFGREAQTDELLARLGNKLRFVAVVGPSGGGKSSLVRAGLIPALRDGMLGDAGFEWSILVMRPGAAPAAALAEAVLRLAPDFPDDCTTRARREFARTEVLSNASDGLTNAIAHLLLGDQHGSDAPLKRSPTNVLLVVDQFEELFRLGRHRGDERTWWERSNYFVQQLIGAAEQTHVPIYVVITMRTEFVGHCATFFGLPDALNAGQYLVPRLTQQQLRDAIERPLQQRGQSMSAALVQRILADSTRVRDELPVLQHAIMRTWQAWKQDANAAEISIDHYELAGPLDDAIDKHAEEIYTGFGASEQRIIEVLFRRVSRKSENVVTRSPVSLRVVAGLAGVAPESTEFRAVVNAFSARGCRMLHTGHNADQPDVEIDVTHEAVLRLWKRATAWIDDEAERAATYRAIVDAAEQFERERIGPWRHPQLGLTLAWWRAAPPTPEWAARYHALRDDGGAVDEYVVARQVLARAETFLYKSQKTADEERESEVALAVRTRQASIYRAGFIGALIAIAVVSFALVYAERVSAELRESNEELAAAHLALSKETAMLQLSEASAREIAGKLEKRNHELALERDATKIARIAAVDSAALAATRTLELALALADRKKALLDREKANSAERRANQDLKNKNDLLKKENVTLSGVGALRVACEERLRRCEGGAADASAP